MYYRLIIVWLTAVFLSAPVMAGNAEEEIVIDPQSGEIIAINTRNNGVGIQEVIEPAKLCLDNQTVQEVRADGTVTCYDTASGSVTSYLNIEIKSAQSVTPLNALETENISPCPAGSALVKMEAGGLIECEPL